MKELVEKWVQNGCDYSEGVAIFQQYGNNAILLKNLQSRRNPTLAALLKAQLLKIAGVSEHSAMQKQSIVEKKVIIESPETESKQKARNMYPNIQWGESNPDMETIYILFGKQITSWHLRNQLHEKLQEASTEHDIHELSEQAVKAELENKACIAELQTYNNTGKFLYEHSIFTQSNRLAELRTMKATTPSEFFQHIANVKNYISRYEKKLQKNEKDIKAKDNLEKYKTELELIQKI